jgi:hypothetical protein
MKKETPQERVSSHLSYMAQDVQQRKDQPPRSHQELEAQRMFADAAMHVALKVVCELLPAEMQPTVKRLLDLREAIWHRHVEPETEGKS